MLLAIVAGLAFGGASLRHGIPAAPSLGAIGIRGEVAAALPHWEEVRNPAGAKTARFLTSRARG
ncbi:MAG: hypothetical protein U1E76_02420 [Planctomycetota bacterium]